MHQGVRRAARPRYGYKRDAARERCWQQLQRGSTGSGAQAGVAAGDEEGTGMEDRQELRVNMLGEMHVYWEGREVYLSQNSAPKFKQLLEMVWLSGERGLPRQQMMRDLYEGRELKSPNNSLNNLLLQMRRHMVAAGLPHSDYVLHKRNLCYVDPAIPMVCDASQFHNLIVSAQRALDPVEKERLYRDAVELYGGPLLPEQSNLPWVEREAGKLTREFREALNFLLKGAYARDEREVVERLLERGREVDPDGDWTEESMRRRRQALWALEFGDDEDGYSSSDDLTGAGGANGLNGAVGSDGSEGSGAGSGSEAEDLPELADLSELSDVAGRSVRGSGGATLCTWDSFGDVVNVVGNNMERVGFAAFLMLIELVDYKGDAILNDKKRRLRMESLRICIERSLRSGDAVTRYGDSAYLILMVGYNEEERARVLRHIRTDLREREGGKAKVKHSGITLSVLR